MEHADDAEIRDLLSRDLPELYCQAVPTHLRNQAFAPGGVEAQGEESVRSLFDEVQGGVCRVYRDNEKTISGAVEMAKLVAVALAPAAAIYGIPLWPAAAILVKVGLDRLCRDVE